MSKAQALFGRKLVWLAIGLLAGLVLITVSTSVQAQGTTWELDQFVVEDGKFELRVGSKDIFSYKADQRVTTIAGLIEIVIGPIQVGDTVVFGRCRQSGSRSTKMHHLTVEKLGVDHNLDDGRWGSDPPGGAVGDSDDPNNNCVFGPFPEPGEYIINDSTDPDAHGVAKFVVEGEAMEGPSGPGPYEPTGLETVVIDPIEVNLVPGTRRSKVQVWIYGSGYDPGQELTVLVSDGNGVLSDISTPLGRRRDGGGHVSPLVTNDQGAWATNWRLGRFTRNGIGGEGIVSILVVDAGFNDLATTPIAFCNISGRAKDLAAALEAAGDDEALQDAANAEAEAQTPVHCSDYLQWIPER